MTDAKMQNYCQHFLSKTFFAHFRPIDSTAKIVYYQNRDVERRLCCSVSLHGFLVYIINYFTKGTQIPYTNELVLGTSTQAERLRYMYNVCRPIWIQLSSLSATR